MLSRFPINNTNWDFEESPDFRDSKEYKKKVEQFFRRIPKGWLSIRSLKLYANEEDHRILMEFLGTLVAERKIEKRDCCPELYRRII